MAIIHNSLYIDEVGIKNSYAEGIDPTQLLYLLSRLHATGFTRYFPDEIKQGLQDKGYLTSNYLLSAEGRKLIDRIYSVDASEQTKKWKEDFYKFWEVFPETDAVNGYQASRSMKGDETKAMTEYLKLRQLGYEAEPIMIGLQNQLKLLKAKSIRRNEMKFMKNIHRWLRDKDFLAWSGSHVQDSGQDYLKNLT